MTSKTRDSIQSGNCDRDSKSNQEISRNGSPGIDNKVAGSNPGDDVNFSKNGSSGVDDKVAGSNPGDDVNFSKNSSSGVMIKLQVRTPMMMLTLPTTNH